jgi:single-stranded DNA-binding protein
MQSQLYLSGRLTADPEFSQTKKGNLIVKLLLETQFVRETTQGNFQSESVILPVSFFNHEAEAVKDCRKGDFLVVGCHLYGTQFKVSDGIVKHGAQITVDKVLQVAARQREGL